MFQAVAQPSIRQLGESIGGDRRASAIPREALQSASVVARHSDISVEVQARSVRTPRRRGGLEVFEVFGIDTVPQSQQSLSCTWTCGDAALNRSGSEHRQQRVLLSQRIEIRRITNLTKAKLLQELCEIVRHADDHAGDFCIVGRWQQVESGRPVFRDFIDAVKRERMDMAVQVDRRAEALQEAHGPALQAAEYSLPARSAPQRCEESPEKEV
jgi:hypothetical protein